MKAKSLIPALIAVVMLIGATFRVPYEYYAVLRWVICAIACWLGFLSIRDRKTGWLTAMIGIAIAFNPDNFFRFSKAEWIRIDIIAACVFSVYVGTKSGHIPQRKPQK